MNTPVPAPAVRCPRGSLRLAALAAACCLLLAGCTGDASSGADAAGAGGTGGPIAVAMVTHGA
jgi:simple sugar transport system substrate-binding protein